jgi:hypothetical protein
MKQDLEVESTDYAQRKYGATPEQVSALLEAVEERYRRLQCFGKLLKVSEDKMRGI